MTLKSTPLDVAMEGDVFLTVISRMPPVETSVAVMVALSCMLLTYSVVLEKPLQRTIEPLLKFEPFTVRVKLPLPANMLVGEIELILGGVEFGDTEEEFPLQLARKRARQAMNTLVEN